MLEDTWFVRASYALFAIAVFAALLKIGAITGAAPIVLRTVPAKPAAAAEAQPLEDDLPTHRLLDLPEPGDSREQASLKARPEEQSSSANGLSIFRRPSPDGAPAGPVCGDLGAFPQSSRAVFPLPARYFDSYEPGWGSPRPQGGHEGTDLMSPTGTPEFAVTDGTLVEVAGANEDGWNRLGGYTVMLRSDYDMGPIRKGDLFYYAHMDRKSILPLGTRVRAGQRLGFAGDTGEGPEVTRGLFPSHLHFGWYDASAAGDRSKVESGAMDPYPLLLWLEENGGAVSGGSNASYCEAPQGPVPTPASPGERPDMDTGDDRDARPSPTAGGNGAGRRDHPPGRDAEPAKAAGPTFRASVAVSMPDIDAPDRTTLPVESKDREDDSGHKDDYVGKSDPVPKVPPGAEDREPPKVDGKDRDAPAIVSPDHPKGNDEPRESPGSPAKNDRPEAEDPDSAREETQANPEPPGDGEPDATENAPSDEQPEPGDGPPHETQDAGGA